MSFAKNLDNLEIVFNLFLDEIFIFLNYELFADLIRELNSVGHISKTDTPILDAIVTYSPEKK